MTEPQYEAYWPCSPRKPTGRTLAPRLSTLEGKTVGLVWDYLFRGDVVYRLLMEGLKERFPTIKFVDWTVFGNMHGNDERQLVADLPAKLREHKVDAVLSSMAA